MTKYPLLLALLAGGAIASASASAGTPCVLEHLRGYEFARLIEKGGIGEKKPPTEWFKDFTPAEGWRDFRRDSNGRAVAGRLRLPVDNKRIFSGDLKMYLVGDFNNWGNMGEAELEKFRFRPVISPGASWNPYAETDLVPLQHGMEYRILAIENGERRLLLDPASDTYSTPSLLRKLGKKVHNSLNSMFWDFDGPDHWKFRNPLVDWRATPGGNVTEEMDVMGMSKEWWHNGKRGPASPDETYNFIADSDLLEFLASHGVTRIKLMPLDESLEYGGWEWSYQGFPFPINSHFGTPAEAARMIDKANGLGIAVTDDWVLGHYPARGNPPPREINQSGLHMYKDDDGWPLFGGLQTEWGTNKYNPEKAVVDRFLRDAAQARMKRYGFSGGRIDNVSGGFGTGIYNRPGGFTMLRGLNQEIHSRFPGAYTNGEAFFSIVNQTKSLDHDWGVGFVAVNHGHLSNWLEKNARKFTDELDMDGLQSALESPAATDEDARATNYKNHDEASNGHAHAAEELQGGGRYYEIQKSKSLDTLAMMAGSDHLTLPQLELIQKGSFADGTVQWTLLDDPELRPAFDYFGARNRYFTQNPVFNLRNRPRYPVNHIDKANKIVSFWRLDAASGKRVLVVGNLGDRGSDALPLVNYRVGVPEEGVYRLKLDSLAPEYGGGSALTEGQLLRSESQGDHGKAHSIAIPRLKPYQWIFLEKD